MTPDRWTLLSWAVSFGQHGFTIAGLSALGLAAWLGGTWWTNRRDQARHQAIQGAYDTAPVIEATPPDDQPDLYDPRTGTDEEALAECRRIWNRTPSREEQ